MIGMSRALDQKDDRIRNLERRINEVPVQKLPCPNTPTELEIILKQEVETLK